VKREEKRARERERERLKEERGTDFNQLGERGARRRE